VKIEELADPVTRADDVFLDTYECAAYLPILPPLLVGHVAGIPEVVALENEGEAIRIPLVRLHPVRLRLRYHVGRNDHAVDPVLGEPVVEVEPLEPRLVDEVDGTLGELVQEVPEEHLVPRLHRGPMDHHPLASHRDLPGLLRILESHKNLFTCGHKILYPTSVHLATSLSLVFCSVTALLKKEGSLSFALQTSSFHSIDTILN